uniref:PH domain-containing protein n=1 Tax=Macrostomum lignano TaxID=282301 RepID=A0A1I8HI83_9PLAT
MNQQITIKAGYLKKQTSAYNGGANGASSGGGGSGLKSISLLHRPTRRWFVFLIFGGLPSLEYYEDSNSARTEAPINSFDLRGCRQVIRSPSDVTSFMLTLADRVLTLTADSETDAADWSDVLNRNLAQYSGRQKPDNIYGTFDDSAAAEVYETTDDETEEDAAACCSVANGNGSNNAAAASSATNEILIELRRVEQRIEAAQGRSAVAQLRQELNEAAPAAAAANLAGPSELASLDPAAYALLEKKYRELEDWDGLGALRTKRFRSVAGVHRPNPDPPTFRRELRPIPLAGFFEPKTDVAVEETDNGRFYVNPLPGGPRLTPLSSAVERLKRQILYPGGVAVMCKSADLLDNVAIVQCASDRFWIAGWTRQATRLHSCLHVISVDGFPIESLDQLRRILHGAFDRVALRLRRLPYGKAFSVQRLDGQSLGLQTVGHKAEICHVQQDGLAAAHGLAYRTTGAVDDANFCTWTIT